MKELIVARNPARRKRRSPAQAAATRKLVALNKRRGRGRPAKRRAPAKSRRRAPQNRRAASTGRRAPRRRNPRAQMFGRGAMGRIINNQVMPALIGGAGGVANDVLYNFIPFPPAMAVGPMRHVGKAASALGMAFLASFFLTKRQADQLGVGALTVVGYNVVREMVQRFAPQIQMGEYLQPLGYYGAGLDPSMGEYLQPMGQVPGAGVSTAGQLTQGTPYLGQTWPVNAEEETGAYDYEM